jgi:putative oxygen-independent coproporphyrinogen III oxidase
LSQPAPLAVYVHWPYCARICPYCDFNVVRDRKQAEQADLARAIVRDLEGQAALMEPRRLSSIFLGGGTPSLMDPAWAADIIAAAHRLWPADGPVEITLEANPTDAEAGRFASFAEAGVQRLSLGVQSLDDRALKFLGRNHAAAEAIRAIELGQSVFPRVSVDLIYALPDQTPEAWAAEMQAVADFGVEHISPYQLTIEAGTAFDRLVRRGAFTPPAEDRAFALYQTTQDVLGARGYEAYEVSNHARGEQGRSVHNLAYWRGWDYVGAGPGAHGRLTLDGGRAATQAEPRVADYIARVAETGADIRQWERLTARDAAIERLLLGLRSLEGVPVAELTGLALNQDHAALFAKQGLITLDNHKITATAAGRAVLDRLTAELIA